MDHPNSSDIQSNPPARGLSWKSLATIATAVLSSVLLVYIGLTRTEVGRDYLRQELESRLTDSYAGRVTIEAVSGNLQRTIRLQNVALYDDQEQLWLQIDEILARPNWGSVIGSRFELSSLSIVRPSLHLEYKADSTWNLSSLLTPRQPTTSSDLEFESADISISEGRISVSYQADAPKVVQSGWLFDLAETNVSNISLEGALNLEPDRRLLAIESFYASIDTLELQVNGELVLEREQLHINTLTLSSSVNQATLVGVLSSDTELADLSLTQGYITPELIQAIVPNMPLPDALTLNGQVQRNGSQWSLQDFTTRSNHSRIAIVSSQIQTHEQQVTFNASIGPSILDPLDFHTVVDSMIWRGGILQIEGDLEGVRSMDELEVSGVLDLLSEGGSTAQLRARAHRGTTWRYDATLSTANLNLTDFTARKDPVSSVNGLFQVKGEGINSPSLTASVALTPSLISGRSLDSLWLEGVLADQRLDLGGFAFEKEAHIRTEIKADWSLDRFSYQARGQMTNLDLGGLFALPELETVFNANWDLIGAGTNLDELSASLEIQTDSSTITWQNCSRSAPPTRWSIAFDDTTNAEQRLNIQGDVLDLAVSGLVQQESLIQARNAWTHAFSAMIDRFATHQRLEQPLTPSAGTGLKSPALSQSNRHASGSMKFTPVELDVIWKLHGHPATAALLPMVPEFSSKLRGSAQIHTDLETLEIQSHLEDEKLVFQDLSAYQTDAVFSLAADLNQELESGWKIDLDLSADSLTNHRITVEKPQILLNQDGRTGTINVYTDRGNLPAQGYLFSGIQLFPDRTRIQIQQMYLLLGDAEWSIPQSAEIDLFVDAVEISPLSLETVSPLLDERQAVKIQGNLSTLTTDTLKLNLDRVNLSDLSSTFELARPFGGQIDADLLWTGLWQPEITGTLEVDTLTFNHQLMGYLQASSVLLPDGSDLEISMILDSIATAPAGNLYAKNQLELTGNMTIPGNERVGALEVLIDVERLDASFLQLILRDFGGFVGGFHGGITLEGPLSDLTLGGSLVWDEGGFGIPRFNSSYDATASVRLRGDEIFVDQLLVQDSDGGAATLVGTLNLNDFRYLSFDASADLDSLQIMNVLSHTRDLAFYGDIRVSGDASLTGPVHTSFLRSDNLVITPQSEIYIPVRDADATHDPGFIIYVDPTRPVETQLASFRQRENILDARPEGERLFRDGLDMDLNLYGPPGSNIRLVIDPLLGDVINGVGTARVQLQRTGGEITTYGSFELSSGDYLFTAGEVFVRRFLIDSGTITWTGEPLNPTLDIQAAYRTRASRSGLPENVGGSMQTSLPLIVNLGVSGTLNAVLIALSLEIDQRQEVISDTPLLDSYLNRPDLTEEHATSVLLTNSFLLSANGTRSRILASSAVNSVSSLVASQLNRYLSQVIPQADFRLGVQSDETVQDLDVSAGIALRLLNERLVIRGQGVYRGLNTEEVAPQGLEGEFIVEIQLSPSVAIEFFYRREGDVLSEFLITSETGLGLNYRTEFTSWRRLFRRQVPVSERTEKTQGEAGHL